MNNSQLAASESVSISVVENTIHNSAANAGARVSPRSNFSTIAPSRSPVAHTTRINSTWSTTIPPIGPAMA
jgi:hypothetical protein